jgi:hypothetical protein
MSGDLKLRGDLPTGKAKVLIDETITTDGSTTATFATDADGVLVWTHVSAITGTLDISIYTYLETGEEVLLTTFPTLSAPTADIVVKKAATIAQRIKIVATYTGTASYKIVVRGLRAGELDATVTIVGANNSKFTGVEVGTSATILLASSLTDRQGFVIKNWHEDGNAILYIADSLIAAVAGNGHAYPLARGEALPADLQSGVDLYAIFDTANITPGYKNVRIIEGGQ